MNNDLDLKKLFEFTEECFGRCLSYRELERLVDFRDGLGLRIDVIKFLIGHCVQDHHASLAYIEKIAVEWARMKIVSVEMAECLLAKKKYIYPQKKFKNFDQPAWDFEKIKAHLDSKYD